MWQLLSSLKYYNLESLCQLFNISTNNLHSTKQNVLVLQIIFQKLIQQIKQNISYMKLYTIIQQLQQ